MPRRAKKPPAPVSPFGARLRALRLSRNLRQTDLAKAASVPDSTITRLERGDYAPTWATVQVLAAALGVSTEELRCVDV